MRKIDFNNTEGFLRKNRHLFRSTEVRFYQKNKPEQYKLVFLHEYIYNHHLQQLFIIRKNFSWILDQIIEYNIEK